MAVAVKQIKRDLLKPNTRNRKVVFEIISTKTTKTTNAIIKNDWCNFLDTICEEMYSKL